MTAMDPAVRRGFAIGFFAVASVAAVFAWRAGWPPPLDGGRADAPPPPGVALVPKVPDRPAAKSETPAAPPAVEAKPPAAPGAPPAGPTGVTPQKGAAADAGKTTSGDVAALSPPTAAAPRAPLPSAEKGAFDIVRVEPSGELVVAGRCAAGCTAELTANGRTQDKVTADADGNFAMVPPRLPPGDHQLGLRVTGPDGRSAVSEQSVTVSVPAPPSREVVVVLNEPNAPSKILQQPGQAPAAAAPAAARQAGATGALAARKDGPTEETKTPAQTVAALSLGAIDAERGRFFVQGTAPNGAALKVYLNNALIAEPIAGADQRWSVRVERGLTPGGYVARVDHVDRRSGKVVARVEAKFAYEAEVAAVERKPAAPAPRATGAAPQAEPTLPDGREAPADAGQIAGSPNETSVPAPAPSRSDPTAADRPSVARPGAGEATAGAPSGATGSDPALPAAREAAPQALAAAAPASPRPTDAPSAAPEPNAANPVVASIDTAQVRRGDSLWRISRTTYGQGRRYTVIFSANDGQIRNPNLIYPGQVLVLPADKTDAAEAAPR